MESTLSLQANLYSCLTPAGAFYAVSSDAPSAGKTLLRSLLKADADEVVSSEKLLAGGHRRHRYRFEPVVPFAKTRIPLWR